MKIIITESQFKRLVENIIDESDSKRQKFIDILNKGYISYEIKNNKIIIDGDDITSYLITYIPDNVEFNNKGDVELFSLNKMGNNIVFNNDGHVWLSSLNKMGNNIVFNNKGNVSLPNLKEMGDNVNFNNKGFVNLFSIIWFDISSVNFTNNVINVFFGEELFWGNEFAYQLYNIRGKFKIYNNKKGNYEIIK